MQALIVLVALLAMSSLRAQAALGQDTASEIEAVKRVIETLSVAINAAKLDEVLALYADDALIDSKAAKAMVSKAQYGETMKRAFAQRRSFRVETGGLRVSMADSNHATVDGVVYFSSASDRTSEKRQWKLEKRDGRWLIVEAKYQ
jgi:ketosteroid isomerase-like protein